MHAEGPAARRLQGPSSTPAARLHLARCPAGAGRRAWCSKEPGSRFPDARCGLAAGLRALLTPTRTHILGPGKQSALGSGSWGPRVSSVLETKLPVRNLTEMWVWSEGLWSFGSLELWVLHADSWGNQDAEEGSTLSEATWGPRDGLSRKKGVSSES